jgi:peptidoglycan/xylan/chitin deacetylase (PgdA/CDA1 family)
MSNQHSFIRRYDQIPKKKGWRPFIRSKALDLLSSIPGNFQPDPTVQLVYLHHIFEDEKAAFRTLLSRLADHYTFISHSEAVKRILQQQIDRPFLSFSLDDGFKNCMEAAAILDEFDAKACFFVCPALIGLTDFQKIQKFNRQQMNFPPVTYMDWKDIDSLLKRDHEIGSHTMTHINIAKSNHQITQEEIFQSAEVLKNRTGKIGHFAWPYGRFSDFTQQAKELVFKAGFDSCASAVRGAHPPLSTKINKEDLCLRRDHVIAAWPLKHSLYFIRRSSKINSSINQYWPEEFRN